MQCCETTHSFVHHLDSSFDVHGKSTVVTMPVGADVPEMMSSGLMTSAASSPLKSAKGCECAARAALVKPLNTSTSCDCDTQSEAALETLVSSMIESFFVGLEDESSSGV